MIKKLSLLVTALGLFLCGNTQLLSWTPDFGKDNDNIVITMDATKGNQGLMNYTPTSDVYVHIGVITNLSSGPTDWKYAKFTWGTTNAAAQATYLGNNKWSYTISNPRTFFNAPTGVPAGETILRIAILFRNGSGSTVLRNADGSDMYVPIYDNTVAVRFTAPFFQPFYNPVPETINKQVGENISLTAISNKPSTLKLFLNGTEIQSATAATTISATPTLTTSGTQTIMAEANDGTTTKQTSFTFFVSAAPVVLPLPTGVRDGINYEAGNTSAVLVLYAPGKARVSVIGDLPGSNWAEQSNYVMNKTPDGNYWWLRITGLTPGTEYAFQYLVNGNLKVAEPYCEKILDPNNDGFISATTYPSLKPYPTGLTTGVVSVLQTNAPAYNWQVPNFTRPDKRSLVVYEMLLRDFVAAHDWKTLRDTLTYFKRLGINAIELMPLNEFEGNDSWGYNPDFYFAPDKYYGPANTLREFVDSCHKNGIAVIMDIALNHATGLCPLAALYWNNATSQPAADNPWFNVTARHPFNVFNDFNHESLATRYFTSRVMEHWLVNYKIDGFRFDLSKGFTQVNSGTDVNLWGQYDASRVAIWKRYYDTMQLKSPGSYTILEHFAANQEETELSDYGMMLWGNSNYNFSQGSMGVVGNSNFESYLHSVRGWSKPGLVSYMESHDEERLMYNNINGGQLSGSYNVKDLATGLRRQEMTASFLLGAPGPKMMWEFGELGYDFSINTCADLTINNNCRLSVKPIRWNYQAVTERKRLFDIYAALMKLRAHGWYKDVFNANGTTITRSMSGAVKNLTVRSATDSSMLCVIGNFDVNLLATSYTFPAAGTWYDYLTGGTIAATGSAQSITLQPGEYHVYLNRNLVNAVTTPVTNVVPGAAALQLKLTPNPAVTNTMMDIILPESGKVQWQVMDAAGKLLFSVDAGMMSKGDRHIDVSPYIARLPAGTYMMMLRLNNKQATIKFVRH